MIVFGYYLLKVCICSAILYAYYWLALRNKLYHYWNRFYLLGSVLLSIFLPLVRIPVEAELSDMPVHSLPLVSVINTGDVYVDQISTSSDYLPAPYTLLLLAFSLISTALLFQLLQTFIRIRGILKRYEMIPMEGMLFLNTKEPGTPFSFLRYIFWNESIPADSTPGSQILKHEIVHVQQKHTYDKIFLQVINTFFWINPVFWLIRKEISMIHEFIADKESIENNDTSILASMILRATYPEHQFSLGNYFFHSPVKRRLKMLIQSSNPRHSYVTRVLALPLLLIIVAAFSLKTADHKKVAALPGNQVYTIVVDAGHGGSDDGVRSEEGLVEKNLTLSIAKKLQSLNKNPRLKILLTRESDIYQPVQEKLSKTLALNPDAFLTIHINNAPVAEKNGFEVFISSKNEASQEKNLLLGSAMIDEMSNDLSVEKKLQKSTQKGIFLLDAPQVNYPAILIECGYLSNPSDRSFLASQKNIEIIASSLLKGLERYLTLSMQGGNVLQTQIDSIVPSSSKVVLHASTFEIKGDLSGSPKPLIIINGKEEKTSKVINTSITADSIVSYPKDDSEAINIYGGKAKNGVLIFYNAKLSPSKKNVSDTLPRGVKSVDVTESGDVIVIFTNGKAEKMKAAEAQKKGYFPVAVQKTKEVGPVQSMSVQIRGVASDPLIIIDGVKLKAGTDLKSIESTLKPDDIESITVLKDAKATDVYGDEAKNGVLLITTKTGKDKLIEKVPPVEKVDGHKIEKPEPTLLDEKIEPVEEVAIEKQTGDLVEVIADGYPIFKKVAIPAIFKDGEAGLNRYVTDELNKKTGSARNELTGECELEFIVDKNGNVGNFKSTKTGNNVNLKLAKTVMEILKSGPTWKPAVQNGMTVSSYQQFSFKFN